VDPTRRGPDWMKITPVAGSLFHERTHKMTEKRQDHALHAVAAHARIVSAIHKRMTPMRVPSINREAGIETSQRGLQVAPREGRRPCRVMSLKHQFVGGLMLRECK